jgi:glyoxylase-like metal-dependent hydrolase (beta-lactamase superfamily II)
MQRILDNIYTFSNLLVGRVYAIKDTDGWTLIDAGLKLAAPRILAQLKTAGVAATDVKRILITHGHIDHVGGLPDLRAVSSAAVLCGADERAYVEGKQSIAQPQRGDVPPLARLMMPPKPQTMAGTPVTRVLQDGEVLPEVLGGLQAVATPGHSPGHMSYWQPTLGVLFTGDVIMRTPGLRLPFAGFTTDMAQNVLSIQRIAALEPKLLLFGHGTPMHNAAPKLKLFAGQVSQN